MVVGVKTGQVSRNHVIEGSSRPEKGFRFCFCRILSLFITKMLESNNRNPVSTFSFPLTLQPICNLICTLITPSKLCLLRSPVTLYLLSAFLLSPYTVKDQQLLTWLTFLSFVNCSLPLIFLVLLLFGES